MHSRVRHEVGGGGGETYLKSVDWDMEGGLTGVSKPKVQVEPFNTATFQEHTQRKGTGVV